MTQTTETRRTSPFAALTGARRFGVAVGILAFVLAMAVSARVAVPVPWSVVPMTLQPAVVLLAGVVLGPWAGAAAMASYLALGAAGAPVFAGGQAGLPWLVGPTGGYLMAFPAAALAVGLLAGGSRSVVRLAGAFAAGLAVVYAGGVAQLMLLTGQDPAAALAVGVLPFLGGDLVKALLALLVVRAYRTWSLGR